MMHVCGVLYILYIANLLTIRYILMSNVVNACSGVFPQYIYIYIFLIKHLNSTLRLSGSQIAATPPMLFVYIGV